MKKLFIILVLLIVFQMSGFSQKDTLTGHFFPYNQGQKGDSVVQVMIPKEKPKGLFGKILFNLSPVKYDVVEMVIPSIPLAEVDEDTTLYLLPKSNHVEQDNINSLFFGYQSEEDWDAVYDIKKTTVYGSQDKKLNKIIYGYHPYWMGTAYESYNFNLLTRIAYFSYSLNPLTGDYKSIHSWNETPLIELAHQNGCKVDLCVTNFGTSDNEKFLSNETAQKKLISNIILLLTERDGDGVNINFESIPKKNRDDFSAFMIKLKNELIKTDTSYKITVTIPAIDWRNAYDVSVLKDYVDYFFLMGYDFFGKYSAIAGPNSLLFSGADWSENNINSTINYYIEKGANPSTLILGLPYYGNEWITSDTKIPSNSLEFVSGRSFSYINNNYADKYLPHYDSVSHSIYYIFRKDDKWVQVWTDNEISLAIKYDYINEMNLGGLGIWALGYDNGYPEYWQLIDEKFTVKQTELAADIQSQLDSNLNNSLIQKALLEINKTNPDYVNRFDDKLKKSFRVFLLIFSIILVFAIIGFIVAIIDFDVRFVLFNKEIRVYIFIGLLLLLILLLLKIFNLLQNSHIIIISAILIGLFTSLIILNVGKTKRQKRGEIKP